MKSRTNETIWFGGIIVAVLIMALRLPLTDTVAEAERATFDQPGIQITVVPPPGEGPVEMERIAGVVSGVNLSECECRVVLFAETNVYWVQPYANAPFTAIKADLTWETNTHLGHHYAALLVRAGYQPPTTTDSLPAVGGSVLAVTRVRARE